jgi:hypothetical protein
MQLNFLKKLIPLSVILFIFYCYSYLNQIGLNYDETQFVNAALGGITDDFISKRIFGVPVFIVPYVGALKAYLYYPIFKLFNVSTYSIRIPAILLSTITIFIWYRNSNFLLKNIFFSFLFILLLSSDVSFIILSTVDWGPIVIQNLLIAFAFYFFFLFIEKNKMIYFAITLCLMLLGLFNKLNFIWFIIAFSLSTAVFYYKIIYLIAKSNLKIFIGLNVVFASILLYTTIFLIIPAYINIPMGAAMFAPFLQKTIFIIKIYLTTMNGSLTYLQLFNHHIPYTAITNIIELSVISLYILFLLISPIVKIKISHEELNGSAKWLFSIFILIFMQLLITPQARAPEHMIMLWPLQHLLLLLSIQFLIVAVNKKFYFFSLLPCIIICSQIYVNHEYSVSLQDKKTPLFEMWTKAIYSLSDYINQHIQNYDAVLSIDFGINNQIFSLSKNNKSRKKIHDIWLLFTINPNLIKIRNVFYPFFNKSDEENEKWLYENYFKNKESLVITYSDHEEVLHAVERFAYFAFRYSISVDKLIQINDDRGQPIYNVFSTYDKSYLIQHKKY